nr:hypothetical protein [Streptomyces ferrugineus]
MSWIRSGYQQLDSPPRKPYNAFRPVISEALVGEHSAVVWKLE